MSWPFWFSFGNRPQPPPAPTCVTTKTIIEVPAMGTSGAVVEDVITTSPFGTSSFWLTYLPVSTYPIRLFVNGVLLAYGKDYTVSRFVVTSVGTPFPAGTLIARYATANVSSLATLTVVDVLVEGDVTVNSGLITILPGGNYRTTGAYTLGAAGPSWVSTTPFVTAGNYSWYLVFNQAGPATSTSPLTPGWRLAGVVVPGHPALSSPALVGPSLMPVYLAATSYGGADWPIVVAAPITF
jgi:hypothetical protein